MTAKNDINITTSAIIDNTTCDAGDVLAPLGELRDHVREGLVSVSPTDTAVKPLTDALTVGAGLSKTVNNPSADATIELALDSIQPANMPLFEGTDGISDGEQGAVPAPLTTDAGKFLRADGAWANTASSPGTVTEIGVTVPTELSVTPATITDSGTFAITKASQSANRVFARGAGSGVPTFQALAVDHIPTLTASKISNIGLNPLITQTATTEIASLTINIPANSYKSLVFDLLVRTTVAAFSTGLITRFNEDAVNTNYVSLSSLIYHTNTLLTNEKLPAGATTGINMHVQVPGSSASGGFFAFMRLWIENHSVSDRRLVRWQGLLPYGTTTQRLRILDGSAYWLSTAALTSITILPSSAGNIANDTRYALYGVL